MNPVANYYKWVLLALTLWREARGCTHEQKRAVAHVIANRATAPNAAKVYGHGIPGLVGILIAPYQFTSISPPRGSVTSLPEWINATTWPVENDPNWAECCQIADDIGQAKDGPDPTNGATHYYTTPIPRVPDWADPAKLTLELGVFRFYRL